MKRVVVIISLTIITVFFCACGKVYTCNGCEKQTTKAYYYLHASKEDVMCEDCAREYWMPLPYEDYRVKE